jgi:hypothetical protein
MLLLTQYKIKVMQNKINYGKNMKLVSSYWGNDDTSFKLIPVSDDCPYTEVVYIPETTLMVVISKIAKQNFQMFNTLNDDGDIEYSKKVDAKGKKQPKQKRTQVEVFQEYYIINTDEQEEFIKEFAVNADTFNYNKFLRDIEKESKVARVEKAPIVDTQGAPILSMSK